MRPRLSMMIATPADDAFEAFADVEKVPEWLSVVRRVRVLARDGSGLPHRVEFEAGVGGRALTYELLYENDRVAHRIRWATPPGSERRFAGSAEFEPLGNDRCLFHYELAEEPSSAVPDPAALPLWTDQAWVAMKYFGDWIGTRTRRPRSSPSNE